MGVLQIQLLFFCVSFYLRYLCISTVVNQQIRCLSSLFDKANYDEDITL